MKNKQEKKFLKLCKKEIERANRICRKAPTVEMVNKKIEELSQYTNILDINRITEKLSKEDLQEEYEKCKKIKVKSEKIFIIMRGFQLAMATSIQELLTTVDVMEHYINDIQDMLKQGKNEDLSVMQLTLRQNISSINNWIQESKKLVNILNTTIDAGISLFKNYSASIIKLQKERLK